MKPDRSRNYRRRHNGLDVLVAVDDIASAAEVRRVNKSEKLMLAEHMMRMLLLKLLLLLLL